MNGEIDEGDSDVGFGSGWRVSAEQADLAEIVQMRYLAVIPKEPGGLVLGSIFSQSLFGVSIS